MGWEVIPWSLRHARGHRGRGLVPDSPHEPAIKRDFVAGTRRESHYSAYTYTR